MNATDADGDSLTYSISGSEINISSSGVLTFATAPDYETKNSYTTTVTVSDGAESSTQAITVNVTDVNDNNPVITSAATFSAAENQTSVGTVTASDADGDSLTFSISGTDASFVSINPSTGVITFNSAPDYENKSSYSATVTVSDGTNSTSQALTINVTNVNDNSPIMSTSTCNISSFCLSPDEEQITMGTINVSDADGDLISFSLSGDDASNFSISASGVLTSSTTPDAEGSYSLGSPWYKGGPHQEPDLNITASDGVTIITKALSIYLQNINDNSPSIILNSSYNVEENQTSAATATYTDADGAISNYSFMLGGTDASSFNINDTSGQPDIAAEYNGTITFKSAPDYESKTSYSVTVTVSDGTNSASQALTINVTNVNEAPIISASNASTLQIEENTLNILNIGATDPEGSTISYSSSNANINISSEGLVSFVVPPDYDDVFVSGNRNWGSFCQNYQSTPVGGVGWVGGAAGCQEGTIPRNNNSVSFTVTASDGSLSSQKIFSYVTTDDPSDITVGWTTDDPPIYYRPQGGLVRPGMYPTGINSVRCLENYACTFKLTINSYSAPEDILISMHSISGTSSDLSEFEWLAYNNDSCRKDYAAYGINAQNRGVEEQGGYVLTLDKNCLTGSSYDNVSFHIWPPKDFETFGSTPLSIYLKITDGTNTTYFPWKIQIYDDPDN
jgi:hypothetical protein